MPKWHPLSVWALAWALAGCDACAPSPVATPPTRFIDRGAEGVVEVRDIGVLGRAKAAVLARLSRVVTPSQVGSLVRELELSFGFDPTSPEGLRAAGLSPHGSVAIQVVGGGRGALWIVPVTDRRAFEKAIKRIVRARTPVDEVQPFETEVARGHRFLTQFGPKMVVVAAYVVHRGHAVVGGGPTAEALVTRAVQVSQDATASIEADPAYVLLTKELGEAWELRWVAPSGRKALSQMLQMVGRFTNVSTPPSLSHAVQSLGGIVDFEGGTARMHGRVHLTPRGRERLAEALETPRSGPGVLAALDVPAAVVHVRAAGRPAGWLEMVAPEGSALRRRVDRLFARVNREAKVDVSREVIPNLSGHAAFSFGLRNLGTVPFDELTRDPLAASWIAAGLGVTDPEWPRRLTARVGPRFFAKKTRATPRAGGGPPVRVLTAEGSGALPAVEMFSVGDAWMFSTEPGVTDAIVNQARPSGDRRIAPGLQAQVRFRSLSKRLRELRSGDLPLLYRSVVTKVIELVGVLDRGELRVTPADGGLAVDATMALAPEVGGDS